jgi:hypothetical protein
VVPDVDVTFLHNVLGPVFTFYYTYGDAKQFRRRFVVQARERLPVALAGGAEQASQQFVLRGRDDFSLGLW